MIESIFLNFWTVCALAQSSTNWGENSWFEGFVYGRESDTCRCEFVPKIGESSEPHYGWVRENGV